MITGAVTVTCEVHNADQISINSSKKPYYIWLPSMYGSNPTSDWQELSNHHKTPSKTDISLFRTSKLGRISEHHSQELTMWRSLDQLEAELLKFQHSPCQWFLGQTIGENNGVPYKHFAWATGKCILERRSDNVIERDYRLSFGHWDPRSGCFNRIQ